MICARLCVRSAWDGLNPCRILCPQHPMHFMYNKLHADISPVAGHDGHDKPAGGSYFHYIHHRYYEFNYGTPL